MTSMHSKQHKISKTLQKCNSSSSIRSSMKSQLVSAWLSSCIQLRISQMLKYLNKQLAISLALHTGKKNTCKNSKMRPCQNQWLIRKIPNRRTCLIRWKKICKKDSKMRINLQICWISKRLENLKSQLMVFLQDKFFTTQVVCKVHSSL